MWSTLTCLVFQSCNTDKLVLPSVHSFDGSLLAALTDWRPKCVQSDQFSEFWPQRTLFASWAISFPQQNEQMRDHLSLTHPNTHTLTHTPNPKLMAKDLTVAAHHFHNELQYSLIWQESQKTWEPHSVLEIDVHTDFTLHVNSPECVKTFPYVQLWSSCL